MTDARHRRGLQAETVVANWLAAHGWTVLDRRWRIPAGELDLVCLDPDGWLVAVEVRFRASRRTGSAAESVGLVHLGRLRRALAAYARQNPGPAAGVRIDLVTVGPAGPDRWRLQRVPGIADGH